MANKQLGLFDTPPEEKKAPTPKFAVLDFETGGLDPKECGLCSVAITQLDEDFEEYDRFYFVLYEPGKRYEADALRVNGFTLEQLERDGLRPETFTLLLHQLVDRYVMVNHNSAFDCKWLLERGWDIKESVCTMENSLSIWPGQRAKLRMVYNRIFGSDFEGAHNALDDTAATCEVLRWQVKKDPKYGQPKKIVWDRYKR